MTWLKTHGSIPLLTVVVVILAAPSAYAQAMQDAICYMVFVIWGPLGTAMSVLAISSVAAAATMGKASWGMALTVCAGIALVFGASQIADLLGVGFGGGSAFHCPEI
jgi:type IV secretory pathway VirB2 component (pilin)